MHINVYVTGDIAILFPTLNEIPPVIQFSFTLVEVMRFSLYVCISFLWLCVNKLPQTYWLKK